MSSYHALARHVLAPAMDLVRGTHTMSCLRQLEESQWWPRERIEELQSERLQRLVGHAYAHVPYYRRLMDERGIRPAEIRVAADLRKLPVLTRELVHDNFRALMAQGFPRRLTWTATTGGSTGTPLLFHTTAEDRRTHGFARSLRAFEFADVALADKKMMVRLARSHHTARDRFLHRISRPIERTIEMDAREISLDTLPDIVTFLRRSGTRCLSGYPSAISSIASWILESGSESPDLRAVVTGGEQLLRYQRERIRDVFHVEPHSKYSCQEAFEIAMECKAHTGLHVATEDLVVEVVDDEADNLPPGSEGRILVTNLHNYAMPFIRYENGDAGAFVAKACSCGRGLPLLSHVVGAKRDVIHTPSGRRVSGSNLGEDRLALLPVRQFQFIQEELDHLVVFIVPRADAGQAELEDMRRRIPPMFNEVVGDDVHVEVQFRERIESTPAGKYLAVVSKVDPDSWLKRATR